MNDSRRNETKRTTNWKNRPAPQVKQTLTSKYRMLKANPLLMHELAKKLNNTEECVVKPDALKTLVAVLDNNADNGGIHSKSFINPTPGSLLLERQRKFPTTISQQREKQSVNVPDQWKKNSVKLLESSRPSEAKKKNRNQYIDPKKIQLKKPSQPLLFSDGELINEKTTKNHNYKRTVVVPNFITPSNATNHKRMTMLNIGRSNLKCPISSNVSSKEMTKRLSDWLKQRGKSVRKYHHLKCFGVHAENIKTIDAEKENIAANVVKNDYGGDDDFMFKEAKNLEPEIFNLSTVAQDALLDLHNLILEGYPPERCEVWLKLIKQKYKAAEQESQYWECRAALEQTKGNINLAVECYKTAIIQGAEVQNVDKYLDQLLHKFSLLNITNADDVNTERCKIIEDARNVFKSSIIQFAVQERIFKRKNKDGGVSVEKKLIATPVRRSTRLSRSAFISTPGIHIYSSLQEVESSVRKTLNFQCNNALKD